MGAAAAPITRPEAVRHVQHDIIDVIDYVVDRDIDIQEHVVHRPFVSGERSRVGARYELHRR